MDLILELDMEKCVACGACAVACMDQNDFQVEPGALPFRTVRCSEGQAEGGVRYRNLSLACMHCKDAPCIRACPSGCLSKDLETGFTVYDSAVCIGCRSCAAACPFGAPRFGPDGKMHKCDGCVDRVKAGLEPACVRICPFDALSLRSREEVRREGESGSLYRAAQQVWKEV